MLNPEIGGEESNSYVDLTEAGLYFATRLDADAWYEAGVASPPTQEAALITAAYWIDQESFPGVKADAAQALEWPREGVRDRSGNLIASDVIPEHLKRAQMVCALRLLEDEELTGDTGLEAFEEIRVGPILARMRSRSGGKIPIEARRFLKGLLGGSPAQFRMVRG